MNKRHKNQQFVQKQAITDLQQLIETLTTHNLHSTGVYIDSLFYSDQLAENPYQNTEKSKWMSLAYDVQKHSNRVKLIKVLEYNKISIVENDQFLKRNTEIEILLCQIIQSDQPLDEFKQYLSFQGIEQEQQALIYSILELTKSNVKSLYNQIFKIVKIKKCQQDITSNKNRQLKEQKFIYFQDVFQLKSDYINFVNELAELFDNFSKMSQKC